MNKLLGIATATGLGVLSLAGSAGAAPVGSGSIDNANLILVAQGCGIGWHRNFHGYCVPYRRVYYRAPVYHYPRVYPRVYYSRPYFYPRHYYGYMPGY